MKFRKYNHEQDKKSAFRVWEECGWVEDDDKDRKAFDIFNSVGRSKVVDVNDSVECFINADHGKMIFGDKTLKITGVTGVTVSRLLRKQGAAPKLLASMIKEETLRGTHVAGLGMFEQGFYNRLGFTTMGYEHWYTFDPSKISIFKKGGVPVRISADDWKEAHKCLSERKKSHGSITFDSPELLHAVMLWSKNGFGLGYKTDGKLTHYIWLSSSDIEEGPYRVAWMAYGNWNQFLELMGILKCLEEQIRSINMREPAFIQLQDFIEKPFQLQTITRNSKFESRMRSMAYQQLRICNLEECVKAVQYQGDPFSFNLSLTDPLLDFLPDDDSFKGCMGDFTVNIGRVSSIKDGRTDGLPIVDGSINGFTRLWIGILPPSTLGLTEDLNIDKTLFDKLEKVFYRPDARSDWDY